MAAGTRNNKKKMEEEGLGKKMIPDLGGEKEETEQGDLSAEFFFKKNQANKTKISTILQRRKRGYEEGDHEDDLYPAKEEDNSDIVILCTLANGWTILIS